MKTIKYEARSWVQGSNTYMPLDIADADREFLIDQMLKWTLFAGELDATTSADFKYMNKSWWHKPDKGTYGKNNFNGGFNSPCAFVSGLLGNMLFRNQIHVTTLQKDKLETISFIMSHICLDFEQFIFQIKVD